MRPRLPGVVAALVLATAALTACVPASELPSVAGRTPAGTSDSIDEILADAPVAGDLPAGSLMADIRARGTLRVGGTDAGPIFSIKDPITGRLTGFDADLSKLLAKYIVGTPSTSLTITSVATREVLLQNGTVDTVFATYTITAPRAEKVDFAGPYYQSGQAILVRSDNSSITSVDDLNGKTVATESNSTAATAIAKFAPQAKVQLFADDNSCVQAVQQGRADAYVLDQGILLGDAAAAGDVKVVGQPFTEEPYGIGTPKQHPEMKQFVNGWLRTIEASGLWQRVYALTVGQVVDGDPPPPPEIGSADGS